MDYNELKQLKRVLEFKGAVGTMFIRVLVTQHTEQLQSC